jgi:hypothetical protein
VLALSDVGNPKLPSLKKLVTGNQGVKFCVAETVMYLSTLGSVFAKHGFVAPAPGQVTEVLSTHVQNGVETVGVAPDGKMFRFVSWVEVTLGFALATSAPERVPATRPDALFIKSP